MRASNGLLKRQPAERDLVNIRDQCDLSSGPAFKKIRLQCLLNWLVLWSMRRGVVKKKTNASKESRIKLMA